MGNKPTTNDIKKAYIKAAHIVSKYGDIYLPIFERLEKEYQRRMKENDLLTRAHNISRNNKVN